MNSLTPSLEMQSIAQNTSTAFTVSVLYDVFGKIHKQLDARTHSPEQTNRAGRATDLH